MCMNFFSLVGAYNRLTSWQQCIVFIAICVNEMFLQRNCVAQVEISPCGSSSGRYLAYDTDLDDPKAGKQKHLVVWELPTCTEVLRIQKKGYYANCDIHEGRRLVVIAGGDEGVQVWSLETKEKLWHHESTGGYQTYHARFVANGDYVVVGSNKSGRNVEIMRSQDGERATRLVSSYDEKSPIQISPDGTRAYICQSPTDQAEYPVEQTRLACFDVTTGKLIGACKLSTNRSAWFSVGTNYLIESVRLKETEGPGLIVWDTRSFTEVRRIPLRGDDSASLPFIDESTGSAFAVTRTNLNKDFCAAIFQEASLETGEIIGQHAIMQGLTDSGPPRLTKINGVDAVAWLNGSTCFLAKYKRPLSTRFSLALQSLPGARNAVVTLPDRFSGIKYGNPDSFYFFLKKREESRSNGQWETWNSEWNQYHERNSRNFISDPQSVSNAIKDLLQPSISLKPKNPTSELPRLFVLSIGVAVYKFDEYDLRFASKDALAIANSLSKQKGQLFDDVQLLRLTDAEATSQKIRDALQWLKRSATENDIVVLFFSGHGLRAKRGLYFFTYDGDENDIYNTCVNWQDVAESLVATPAKAVILLTDCCHAGSFSGDRFLNQNKIAEALGSRKNIAIFASSSGTEVSFELDSLSQGVFTHSVIAALSGQADSNTDGVIDWDELVNFVSSDVPRLTQNKQHPQLVKPGDFGNQLRIVNVPKLDLATKSAETSSRTIAIDCQLMNGKVVVAILPKGIKVKTGRTEGVWTQVAAEIGGTSQVGWVKSESLVEPMPR